MKIRSEGQALHVSIGYGGDSPIKLRWSTPPAPWWRIFKRVRHEIFRRQMQKTMNEAWRKNPPKIDIYGW